MTLPDLNLSGIRLKAIDTEILRLIRLRMRVAEDVIRFKHANGGNIIRRDVESARITQMGELAKSIGVDANLAQTIEWVLIGESCKVQIEVLQNGETGILPGDEEARYEQLKANLIRLTSHVARTYTESGGDQYPGTKLYVDYESNHIMNAVKGLSPQHRGKALDLGCAAGRVARLLSPHFATVTGYDLSHDMVNEAWRRCNERGLTDHNIHFEQHDLDLGIPEKDASVDLVVMSLGTASDIRNIRFLLKEIGRVLTVGGAFVLSFYNKDALIYNPGFIAFDPSLLAHINVDENCLEVYKPESQDENGNVIAADNYLVYARPYDWSEIETMVGAPLRISLYRTYPTIAAVMPRILFEHSNFSTVLPRLEQQIEYSGAGAYYLISGIRE
jgi:SAM-dependent methyltransferase/chorismate mutase